MTVAVLFIASIFGLAIGSFLNVVIWRLPQNHSVVKPSSRCPNCAKMLSPFENVPVFSFIFLGGKCSGCKESISIQYPLIELANAAGYLIIFAHFKSILLASIFAIFFSTLLTISVIDVQTRKIPRKILYVMGPTLVVGLALFSGFSLHSERALFHALEGALIGLVIFGAIHMAAPRSMGMGDVRLAAFIGFPLGYLSLSAIVDFIYGAFFLGAIFGIVFAVRKSKTLRVAIPFGPFMSLAALISIFIYPNFRIF